MIPAENSISQTAPTKVVLTFDEKIAPAGTGITVTAPDGARVDVGAPTVLNTELSIKLGPITLNGHYLVNYRVVSADGHPVEASTGFDILIASLAPTAKAKIEVDTGRESKIDKGEGRSAGENEVATVYYLLFAAILVGLFVYWRKRRSKGSKAAG